METLGFDSMTCVLSFLDLKSVVSVLRTSHDLYSYFSNEILWRCLLARESPPALLLSTDPAFSVKKCNDLKSRLWTNLQLSHPHSFLCTVLSNFRRVQMVPLRGIAESSHDFDQDISRTVCDRFGRFWSSIGAESRDSNDFLRYEMEYPAFVFWIGIRLFRAGYQGGVIYPPQQFRIKIGLKEDTWDYVSSPVQAAVSESVQYLVVLPALILGKYVEVELIGKSQTQESDDLFYVAIERVICTGLPGGLFSEEMDLEASCPRLVGKIELEINAENYSKWIEKFCENPNLVQREFLEALQELDKLQEYFSNTMNCRVLNKCESYYFLEQLPVNMNINPLMLTRLTPSEDLGDLFFEKGNVDCALSVYSNLRVLRKIVKCVLKLELFDKCKRMIYYNALGPRTREEMLAMARSLGEDLAQRFEDSLKKDAEEDEDEADEADEDP